MKKLLLGVMAAALMVFGAGTLTATASHGQTFVKTFTVTKTADTNDGKCDSDCSLREAIDAANKSPGYDRVHAPWATYNLTLQGEGDLDITESVWITGDGMLKTAVTAHSPDTGHLGDRIFHIHPGVDATIRGMEINGSDPVHASNLGNGGVILNEGKLLVWRSIVVAGRADKGGGIYNSGSLTLRESNVQGNLARQAGGGLYNAKTATVENSEFHSCRSDGIGGAISNYGTLTLKKARFANNSAASGDPNINPTGKIIRK